MIDLTQPSAPKGKVPLGACDCHMHAYGPADQYPAAPESPFPPVAGGDIESYLKASARLGLARAVVVQPSVYGFDNSCTLDAMARLDGNARGVVVVQPDVTDEELDRLTKLGVRGLRFFLLANGGLGWDDLEPMASRIAPFGWHIQLQTDGRFLHEHQRRLSELPCQLVIDHNGKFLKPVEPSHPGFRALTQLIDNGRTWVKTSGVYETSLLGGPEYSDVAILAKALIVQAPERCLFATNWPHPSKPGSPPDDGVLVDQFLEWCGHDTALVEQIMVRNPEVLYGFERYKSPAKSEVSQ